MADPKFISRIVNAYAPTTTGTWTVTHPELLARGITPKGVLVYASYKDDQVDTTKTLGTNFSVGIGDGTNGSATWYHDHDGLTDHEGACGYLDGFSIVVQDPAGGTNLINATDPTLIEGGCEIFITTRAGTEDIHVNVVFLCGDELDVHYFNEELNNETLDVTTSWEPDAFIGVGRPFHGVGTGGTHGGNPNFDVQLFVAARDSGASTVTQACVFSTGKDGEASNATLRGLFRDCILSHYNLVPTTAQGRVRINSTDSTSFELEQYNVAADNAVTGLALSFGTVDYDIDIELLQANSNGVQSITFPGFRPQFAYSIHYPDSASTTGNDTNSGGGGGVSAAAGDTVFQKAWFHQYAPEASTQDCGIFSNPSRWIYDSWESGSLAHFQTYFDGWTSTGFDIDNTRTSATLEINFPTLVVEHVDDWIGDTDGCPAVGACGTASVAPGVTTMSVTGCGAPKNTCGVASVAPSGSVTLSPGGCPPVGDCGDPDPQGAGTALLIVPATNIRKITNKNVDIGAGTAVMFPDDCAAVGACGTAQVDVAGTATIAPGGCPPVGACGLPKVDPSGVVTLSPGGCAGVEICGTAVVTPSGSTVVAPGGCPSVEICGTAQVDPAGVSTVAPGGCPPVGACGTAIIAVDGEVTVMPGGCPPVGACGVAQVDPSGQVTLSLGGCPSVEACGTPSLSGDGTIVPSGCPAVGACGTTVVDPTGSVTVAPGGCPPVGACGTTATEAALLPTGCPPVGACGTSVVAPGSVSLDVTGCAAVGACGVVQVDTAAIQLLVPGCGPVSSCGVVEVAPGQVEMVVDPCPSVETCGNTTLGGSAQEIVVKSCPSVSKCGIVFLQGGAIPETMQTRIKNALICRARLGTFVKVEQACSGVGDCGDVATQSQGLQVAPSSILVNEVRSRFGGRDHCSPCGKNGTKRQQWTWKMILRFDCDVSATLFDEQLACTPVVLPRLPEPVAGLQTPNRQVTLNLLDIVPKHPPGGNSSTGAEFHYIFEAHTSA